MRMIRKSVLSVAALLPLTAFAKTDAIRPNVVIILADDLGYGDLGCYGATKIKTPNIDRLAEQGMRFINAYVVSPVCCPSRYALMTGTYPWRAPRTDQAQLWATHVSTCLIKDGQPTLASVFQKAGYTTGIIGKWHLGLMNADKDWNKELSPGPLERGFDYFFGDPSNRFQFYIEGHHPVGFDPAQPIREEGKKLIVPPSVQKINHSENARVLNDKACAFITGQAGKAPIFLYYTPNNVHMPLTPGAQFTGSSRAGVYGDFVQELDWTVGEIVKTLEATGQLGNTLIIFSSDNGGRLDLESRKAGHLTNGNLLGQKTDVWEGGVHVNFIAQWQGVISPGTVSDALICLTDIPATAAQIVQADLPAGSFPDGISLLPVLRGSGTLPPDRSVVFNWGRRDKTYGIRQGEWVYIDRQGSGGSGAGNDFDQPEGHYISYAEAGFKNSDVNADGTVRADAPLAQLYNLKTDPGQTVNVFNQNLEKAQHLNQLLEQIKKRK
jgi:arylsulfatase A